MSEILKRIDRKLGVKDLPKLLGEELDPSDLQSLMLEVYRRIVQRRDPKRILAEYSSKQLFRPSESKATDLIEWDRIALSSLPEGFRSLELSPLCPLGTISSLAPISQDWIVTTIRNTDVASDPTNALALECATRRRKLAAEVHTRGETVSLAASQRVVRSQRYDNPAARPHFRLFSMCSAGRDSGNLGFESWAISEHAKFYIKCLRLYLGPSVPLVVSLFDLAPHEPHRAKIISTIRDEVGRDSEKVTVEVANDPKKAKGYYGNIRFHIHALSQQGDKVELIDGGDTDWTQKLLGNAKERLVISGLGTDRLCNEFKLQRPHSF